MRNKLLMKLVFGVFVALITVSILQPSSVILAACNPNPTNSAFADVTGDGKADAIVVNTNGVFVRPAFRRLGPELEDATWTWIYGPLGPILYQAIFGGGAAQVQEIYVGFDSTQRWTSNPYYGDRGTYFADVNLDRRADAIVVNNSNITVRLSDGQSFSPNQSWTTNPYYGNVGTYFADVTGEGAADAIAVNEGWGVVVRPSNGNRFLDNQSWTTDPYHAEMGTYFADVTGDKRADLITITAGGVTVRRSNGMSFGTVEYWTTEPFYGQYGTYFADVTGDGKADAMVVNSNGVTVRPSPLTGNPPFLVNQHWNYDTKYIVPNVGTYFVDVTGEGKADEISVYTTGIRIALSSGDRFNKYAWSNQPYYSDLRPSC